MFLENKKILYFPIKLLLGFLVFSELLLFFGPLEYKIPNLFLLAIFFLIVNVSLFLGYYRGVKKYNYAIKEKQKNHQPIILFLLLFSLLMVPLRIKTQWENVTLSPVGIIYHLTNSLTNPGEVYMEKLEISSGFLTYFCMILSPVTFMTLPIALFNWNKLDKLGKILTTLLLIWELLIPIGQGVRKGIMDVMIIFFFMLIARKPYMLLQLGKYKVLIFSVVTLICLFIYYFIYSNLSRYGLDDPLILVENYTTFDIKENYRAHVAPIILVILCTIEGYLCQGYYALGNALVSDFKFSFGFGSSWFGMNLMNRFGVNMLPYTYLGELEKLGIDPMINWHSIYTWLASDYTFWGVPVFIYFMGNFLSVTWLDTISKRNIFSPAIFILFVIMVFYSFANNQVFSLSFIPFCVIFLLWILFRDNNILNINS